MSGKRSKEQEYAENLESHFIEIVLEQTEGILWEYWLDKDLLMPVPAVPGSRTLLREEGATPKELADSCFIHPDSQKDFLQMHEELRAGRKIESGTFRMRIHDNGYEWKQVTYYPQKEYSARLVGFAAVPANYYDIEDRYFRETQLRGALTEGLIASSRVNLTKNEVEYLWSKNIQKEQTDCVKSYEQMYTLGINSIAEENDKKRYISIFGYQKLFAAYDKGKTNLRMEYQYYDQEGHILWAYATAQLVRDPVSGDLKYFSFIHNIDERKRMELKLQAKAERDEITGLYDKATAFALMREELRNYAKQYRICAMLVVDIDDFRKFLKQFGNAYGRLLLMETGRVLESVFYKDAIIGRTERDEFVVLLVSIESKEWVSQKVQELTALLRQIHPKRTEVRELTVSIGAEFSYGGVSEVERMYENAKKALSNVKQTGKKQYQVYRGQKLSKQLFERAEGACIAKDCFLTFCMLDVLEEMILVIDCETYEILYINEAGEKMLNVPALYPGLKCYEVLQGLSKPCIFCKQHIPVENEFHIWENINVKLNKTFVIKDKLFCWAGKKVRFEMFFDKERMVSQNELSAESLLFQSIQVLMSDLSLNNVIYKVLKNTADYYGADRAYLLQINTKENTCQVSGEWPGNGENALNYSGNELSYDVIPYWMKEKHRKDPAIMEQFESTVLMSPKQYQYCKEKNIHSFYQQPFDIQLDLSGCIGVDNPSKSLGDLSFLKYVSYLLGGEMAGRKLSHKEGFLESHDAMTGVLNQKSYQDFVKGIDEYALSSAGVLSADINGLKEYNRKYGQEMGDALVRKVAGLFVRFFGADNVYRFDGDEFLVLYLNAMQDAFLEKIEKLRVELSLICPNGMAMGQVWTDQDIEIERMVRHADEMMLIVKRAHYQKLWENDRKAMPHLVEEFLNAINNQEFHVVLQPKVEVKTSKVIGAEALVRYRDKGGRIVTPGKFIPMLEIHGLVHYIDFFVFDRVCELLKEWENKGYALFPVSLNFSRLTLLQPDFLSRMDKACQMTKVPKQLLEIEITESYGEIEQDTFKDLCNQIVLHGYRLSLDDFGAKYSNISALSSLPLDILKLDKSIVNNLYSNQRVSIMLENLIQSCHQMKINCVAEGIETVEQLEILKKLDCDYVQGYVFNKPVPISDFEHAYMRQKE